MKSTPFNIATDLPPIPFDMRHCRLAAELRTAGLSWTPHVGCFVWDRDGHIPVPSPFPERIYFILNLGRFLDIFDSLDAMRETLIWLPTWHQARLVLDRLGGTPEEIRGVLRGNGKMVPGEDVLGLYECILRMLTGGR
jgi:hypothetical protein